MGRVASAGDNAAMESFHALLQKNVLDQQRWQTRAELRYAIITWIEHTYNRRRRQRSLGKLTPVEFELAFTAVTEKHRNRRVHGRYSNYCRISFGPELKKLETGLDALARVIQQFE